GSGDVRGGGAGGGGGDGARLLPARAPGGGRGSDALAAVGIIAVCDAFSLGGSFIKKEILLCNEARTVKLDHVGTACIRIVSGFMLLSAAGAQPYLISTVAGGAPPQTPVPATNASISPSGVATDHSGNVYFSSRNAVFKLDPSHSLTRIAGTSRPGFSGDGGRAVDAQLNSPNGLAVDGSGNLYIADSGNGCVRRVSSDGLIATVAGVSTPSSDPGDGGPATQAALSQPFAVAFDAAGNLYIADTISIREGSGAGTINRIAGNGGTQVSPTAMAVDSTGVVYIGLYNRVVRLTAGGVLTPVAGAPNVTRSSPRGGRRGPHRGGGVAKCHGQLLRRRRSGDPGSIGGGWRSRREYRWRTLPGRRVQ